MHLMWMWEKRTACSYGEGLDASRANALGFAAWTWPSNDEVRAFLEGWEEWEKEQPDWYVTQVTKLSKLKH